MLYQQHAENDGCDEKFILSYERAKEMYNMDKNQNSYTSEFKRVPDEAIELCCVNIV